MKPIVVYPVPMDSKSVWGEFKDSVQRFCESFRKYPGGCQIAIVMRPPLGDVDDGECTLPAAWTEGLPVRLGVYHGNGCDIGSAQQLSKLINPDTLMVMLTTRCYLHRPGWLARYVAAFENDRDGLFSASASWEGGKRHLCTRAYAMRAGLFASYPHAINSREDGQSFEIGEWCVTDWFYSQGRKCYQVTFDGIQEEPFWRAGENIYRRGDQTNMLVWDRHTDKYRDADIIERARLEDLVQPRT